MIRSRILPLALLVSVVACEDAPTASGTCLGAQPYTAGTSITGIAFVDDCAAPNGLVGDVHQFTVASQTNLMITMTPSGYAGALGLFVGPFVEGGTPRLVFKEFGRGTFGAKAFLPAGTYYIVAGSDEASGGNYTLESVPTTTTPCTETTMAWYTLPGADITGLLAADDCLAGNGGRQDIFGLNLGAGEALSVSIEIAKSSAVLFRRDGSASAANITQFFALVPNTTVSGTFTAPDPARFNVHVVSDNLAGGTAAYTLHIR